MDNSHYPLPLCKNNANGLDMNPIHLCLSVFICGSKSGITAFFSCLQHRRGHDRDRAPTNNLYCSHLKTAIGFLQDVYLTCLCQSAAIIWTISRSVSDTERGCQPSSWLALVASTRT